MDVFKNIVITPNPECKACHGAGMVRGSSIPVPFGVGSCNLPDEHCECVEDQIPDDGHVYNVFFKFPEPEKPEPRYTWTYGAGEGRSIFINDNSLGDSNNGIAAITLHRIGKEAGERLAHAWCRALDMLAILQGVLPIIENEAQHRELVIQSPEFLVNLSEDEKRYYGEMRQAASSILREIALAQGLLRQTCRRIYPGACEHGFKYTPCPECAKTAEPQHFDHDQILDNDYIDGGFGPRPCPHGFAFTPCPECEKDADNYDYAADDRNFDTARERSMKK